MQAACNFPYSGRREHRRRHQIESLRVRAIIHTGLGEPQSVLSYADLPFLQKLGVVAFTELGKPLEEVFR